LDEKTRDFLMQFTGESNNSVENLFGKIISPRKGHVNDKDKPGIDRGKKGMKIIGFKKKNSTVCLWSLRGERQTSSRRLIRGQRDVGRVSKKKGVGWKGSEDQETG